MLKLKDYSREEREALYASLLSEYNEYCKMNLSLDLSRGKPNSLQLDLNQGIMDVKMAREDCYSESGFDCRNYGILDGVPEVKKFFAEVLGLDKESIIIGGNSSLQLMYDTIARAMIFGLPGSEKPWCQEPDRKWLCVVPGYDRHFRITETMGFTMLNVKMNKDGPDIDEIERLVKDPTVKGIWCIPKYSNPSGNTYSDEIIRRLASMECAAPDFRIFWDNAYAVHDFDENGDTLLNILDEAKKYGNEDRVLYFSSTSKITFPGGGVALMAMSPANKAHTLKHLGAQTIGYDKINQLRHLKYFGNAENLRKHMLMLGAEVKKKFDIALSELDTIRDMGIADWTVPKGGYFISLDLLPGTAKRVYELMQNAGVTLTPVGATYPYGVDPEDKNLRLAPTYPEENSLRLATKVLTVAIRLAALEKLNK